MKPVTYISKPSDYTSAKTKMYQMNYTREISFATVTAEYQGMSSDLVVAVFHVRRKEVTS